MDSLTTDRATGTRLYELRRYEVVVPSVDNHGAPADYCSRFRGELIGAGLSGWTETATTGYWLGRLEPGTTFTIYAPALGRWTHREQDPFAMLQQLARASMPDQTARQVVMFDDGVTLAEVGVTPERARKTTPELRDLLHPPTTPQLGVA
jgi:hypothetical protein